MTVLEIILLIAGAVVFALSFILPSKKQEASDDVRSMIEEEVKKKVTEEIEGIKKHVDGVVDEAVEYAQEKTERSLERISNEKIMAVNEYSDTVLEEINKNHKEVMFLYDMLNDKHDSLVNAVSEAGRVITETKESTAKANEAAVAVKESTLIANEVANVVKTSTREAAETVNTFRSLAPESIVMPEFDISQVLKYSQNQVVNIPNVVIEPIKEKNVAPELKAEQTMPKAEGQAVKENVAPAKEATSHAEEKVASPVESEQKQETQIAQRVNGNAVSENKLLEVAEENKTDSVEKAVPSSTSKDVKKADDNEQKAESNGGKIRTLKWAAYAMQQADAAYEGNVSKTDEAVSMSLATSTDEERAVIQDAILKLHDAGKSDVEIARSLDMGVGEVSLIIGLRSKE